MSYEITAETHMSTGGIDTEHRCQVPSGTFIPLPDLRHFGTCRQVIRYSRSLHRIRIVRLDSEAVS